MSPRATLQRTGLIPRVVSARADGELVPVRAISAAEVLGSLLDLRGSVDLAEILAASPSPTKGLAYVRGANPAGPPDTPGVAATPPVPAPANRRSACEATVRLRLDQIEAGINRRLALPFEDRPRISDARSMAAALADVYGGDFRLATSALAAPFRERLISLVERMLSEVARLREEIGDDLQTFGPVTARLEALDRGLRDVTERAVARLVERLAASLERDVFRDLTRAVKVLPDAKPDLAFIAPWFAAGGWVRTRLDAIEMVTRALFAHERSVLEALVAAPRWDSLGDA